MRAVSSTPRLRCRPRGGGPAPRPRRGGNVTGGESARRAPAKPGYALGELGELGALPGAQGAAPPEEAAAGAARAEMDGAVATLERGVNAAIVNSVSWALERLYPADNTQPAEALGEERASASGDGSFAVPTQRTYARFYVLETIARVPYFSFLSALHLWETVGWWRRADYLKVHFAQTFNELHHLLIMESLGGADRYADRFLAQHAALAYYVYVLAVYLVSPRMAYNFQEQVEEHAFATYDAFLRNHGEALRAAPAPAPARCYYTHGDLYLFHEFQTEADLPSARRPRVETLYDTFVAVRDDEREHQRTMAACQRPDGIRSPHDAAADAACGVEGCVDCAPEAEGDSTADIDPCAGVLDCAIKNPSGRRRKG